MIHRQGLGTGDALPTHRELQRRFNLSNNVLTPAMRQLAAQGVIERRERIGTVVRNARAYKDSLWRVAVAQNYTSPHSASPFYGLLSNFIQSELTEAGCLFTTYLRQPVTDIKSGESTREYAPLEQDAAEGRIDALVALGSPEPVHWHHVSGGLPLIGFSEGAHNGAAVDMGAMTRESVRLLSKVGCRRLCVLSDHKHGGQKRFWEGFLQGLGDIGLKASDGRMLLTYWDYPSAMRGIIHHALAGQRAGQQLLAEPASLRPDGLIVLDDHTAAGLVATLREDATYRPQITVVTQVQAPQVYALPVFRFHFDISELARLGVSVLTDQMLNPDLPDRMRWVAPVCAGDQPTQFPVEHVCNIFGRSPSGEVATGF